MAISGFGRGKGEGMTSSSTTAPPASTGMGGLTAFIDQGSEFEGKLSFKDTVRIDGAFRGEITSENTLIVGETGEIEATIKSTVVVISGTVAGDIHASRQIILNKTASVQGDLETPSIVVEEGAVFNGTLSMKHPAAGTGKPERDLKAVKAGEPGDASNAAGSGK